MRTQEAIRFRKRDICVSADVCLLDDRVPFRNDFYVATTRPAISHHASNPMLFPGIKATGKRRFYYLRQPKADLGLRGCFTFLTLRR